MTDLIERLRAMAGSDMVPMEKAMKLLLEAAAALEAARQEGRKEVQQHAAVDEAWQNKVADALDSFWNPACGAIQEASYHGPASGSDVVGAIAQGLAAVAASLRESALAAQQGGE